MPDRIDAAAKPMTVARSRARSSAIGPPSWVDGGATDDWPLRWSSVLTVMPRTP